MQKINAKNTEIVVLHCWHALLLQAPLSVGDTVITDGGG
jgi:hypothetical protein